MKGPLPHPFLAVPGRIAIADVSGAVVRPIATAAVESAYALGFRYVATDADLKTLDELLRTWQDLRLIVDLKEPAAVEPTLKRLYELNALNRVCFGSVVDKRIRLVRQRARALACTSMGRRELWLARAGAALGLQLPRGAADCIQIPPALARRRRFLDAAEKAGLPVYVGPVNDEPTMWELTEPELVKLVDGVISGRPELLASVFKDRTLPLDGGSN